MCETSACLHLSRWLQSSQDHQGGTNLVVMVSTMVFVIGMVLWCMYSVIRGSRLQRSGNTVLTCDRLVFNLSESQRRLVLEAIFSEQSQTVSETAGSPVHAKKSGKKTSKDDTREDVKAMENEHQIADLELNATQLSTSNSTLDLQSEIPMENTVNCKNCTSKETTESPVTEYSKGHEEEMSTVDLEIGQNVAQSTIYERQETGEEEDVCAICLGEYAPDDVITSSKYCDHIYHKACILEWLEKNDYCPCCRAHMMTESDVQKAADSISNNTEESRGVTSVQVVVNRVRPPVPTRSFAEGASLRELSNRNQLRR